MADLAVWQRTIVDETGLVVPGAEVEVRHAESGALAQLYQDREGTQVLSNPVTADMSGFVRFFIEGGAYDITATGSGASRTWRFDATGRLQEFDKVVAEVITDDAGEQADIRDKLGTVARTANLSDLADIKEARANLGTFSTVADVENSHIPSVLEKIRTEGEAGAVYRRKLAGEPDSPGDITSADGARWELDTVSLSVLYFGAVADGDGGGGGTENSQALQDAIDYVASRGGGRVRIPLTGSGIYRVDSEIQGRSFVHIDIDPGVTLDFTNLTSGACFRWNGSVGPEIKLGANATRGDTLIVWGQPHGLSEGDWFYIKSQRVSVHEDAGDWRLGEPTGSQTGPYFGEVCNVQTVNSSTQVTIAPTLIFPDYRVDNTQETHPNARPNATLQKVNWLEAGVITGGTIISGGATILRYRWALRPYAENVKGIFLTGDGAMVRYDYTLAGHHKNCTSYRKPGLASGYEANAFKDVGSWWCIHENWTDWNGWQSVDVSYPDEGSPSIEPQIIGGTSFFSREAVTFHPGVYGGHVKRVGAYSCYAGINIRSPWVEVSECRLLGHPRAGASGIALGPWARWSVVRGNYISGYLRGVQARTKAIQGEGPTERHRLIKDNDIHDVDYGVYVGDVEEDEPRTGLCGDAIVGNRIVHFGTQGVRLRPYMNGVKIWDNQFVGTGGSSSGLAINTDFNCVQVSVRRNSFYDLGSNATAIVLRGITDQTTFPPAQYPGARHDVSDNSYSGPLGLFYNRPDLFTPPNRMYGEGGPLRISSSLSTSAVHVFENGDHNDNSGASVFILSKPGGINTLRFGTEDEPLIGGVQVSSTSGYLNLRAVGAERVQATHNSFRPIQDNSYALGGASNRFSQVYAGTGTINTSDARLKQDVREFSDAELRALQKVDMVLYRMKDAVSKKGDNARTHAGVIAQQVIEAFDSEGLNAFDYGFVCGDYAYDRVSWEEDGVEHERYEPRLDEEGNHVFQLSVRYTELLSALRAADRARMDALEARLQALEAAT